jgi:hypothetical protein
LTTAAQRERLLLRLAEGDVDEEMRWAFLLYTEEAVDKLA